MAIEKDREAFGCKRFHIRKWMIGYLRPANDRLTKHLRQKP